MFIQSNPKPDGKRKWHLDHIVPVSWFDPFDLNQLKLCWHSNNLQWLTAKENCAKNNKLREVDIEKLTDWHWNAIKKASFSKL